MSRFCTEMVCLDCEDREKAHPSYGYAKLVEALAARNGDYNHPGVGKPQDLQ